MGTSWAAPLDGLLTALGACPLIRRHSGASIAAGAHERERGAWEAEREAMTAEVEALRREVGSLRDAHGTLRETLAAKQAELEQLQAVLDGALSRWRGVAAAPSAPGTPTPALAAGLAPHLLSVANAPPLPSLLFAPPRGAAKSLLPAAVALPRRSLADLSNQRLR